MMQRTTGAALLLGLTCMAGCSDYSPWPPAGGVKEGAYTAREARPLPPGTGEGAAKSLLASSFEEPEVPTGDAALELSLPQASKGLVYAALQAAARDDLDGLLAMLGDTAGYGLPATSEVGSRPIAKRPEHFMDVLRDVGSRMSGASAFRCVPVQPPALEPYVHSGAEPIWCFFGSQDNLDLLAFKLRVEGGAARIAYVGMFEQRPSSPVLAGTNEPPPPPVAPSDVTARNDNFTFMAAAPTAG